MNDHSLPFLLVPGHWSHQSLIRFKALVCVLHLAPRDDGQITS